MKINKILLIFCFPMMAQLLFSCTCCDCEDDPIAIVENEPCTFESLKAVFLDNSGAIPLKVENDSLSKNAFGIQVDLNFKEIYCSNNIFKLDLFPTAQAFSCGCDAALVQAISQLSKFEIIALKPFNNSETDSNITSKFRILQFDRYVELKTNRINTSQPFDLILTEIPDTAQNHQFILRYTLADSSSFSDTTKSIYLF